MAGRGPTLVHLGLKMGSGLACLAPFLGLGLFFWLPFKPAVTLYVLINGLAFVLLKWVELHRLSLELDEIVRRKTAAGSKN